jgi:stage V sporulation protein S
MDDLDQNMIRVSRSTNPKAVASVIAKSIGAGHKPKVRAIGAPAVNQAAKACAIAAGFVAPRGILVTYIVGFDDVVGEDGTMISAMFFQPVYG